MTQEIIRVASIDALHDVVAKARRLRRERPESAIDIELQAGTYRLDQTLELHAEDSGTPDAPLRIRSAPGQQVVLSGSREIGAFGAISSPAVRDRLSAQQQAHIVEISMAAAGIPPIAAVEQRGQPPLELFHKGQRLPLTRFPNTDWLQIEDVPQHGPQLLHEGLEREKRYHDVPVGRHYGRFVYPGERPQQWAFHDEILVHGYWTWDWNDSYQMVAGIDTDDRCVILAEPHHSYGYTTKQRFAFCNVLEEIDAPGAWCFHRGSGRIYLWPPEDDPGELTASVHRDPLISISDAAHIRIEGIEFCESLGSGICIDASHDVSVVGCNFSRLGDTAVVLDGTRNEIRSCDFHDLSLGAISVTGGDRATLTPGENRIDNNHIWDFSRWVRTYQYAIRVDGVAHRVTHNLVHDAPQEAMRFGGNEHLFEFNEIHSVVTETGDSGAIHTGRDWTWRGTVLRHNLIHNLAGAGLHGAMGIYLDDFMSGTAIQGNIFCYAGRAAFIGGGRDNLVENNLFIACKASVHVDARGTSWAAYYFDGTYPVLFEAMTAMRFRDPPYADRYPELIQLYDDDPAIPKNNRIRRNISFSGLWLELRDQVRIADVTHDSNYVADEILCEQLRPDLEIDPYYLNLDGDDPYERLESDDDQTDIFARGGNVVARSAVPVPGWRDRDFTVDTEVAEQIGFEQIPFRKIGLYCDAYRRQLPPPKMPMPFFA
jgi:hypothetical protein